MSAGLRMRISFGRSRWPIHSWSGCSESQNAAAAEPSTSYCSEFLRPGLSWLMATDPRAPFSKRSRIVATSSVAISRSSVFAVALGGEGLHRTGRLAVASG